MDKKMLEVWKETLGKMTYPQLLRTECKISPDIQWKKMFLAIDVKLESLKCVLCETATISKLLCIRQHILGKKHIRKMEQSVTAIRHTHINPFKVAAGGAGATKPNPNNKGQTNVSLKPVQGDNKQPGNVTNQSTQKPGTAPKPANQSNQKTGTLPNPANQKNQKSGIAPKVANQNNQKPGTLPNPVNPNIQKPGTLPNPVNPNIQKPVTLPNPINPNIQKPGTLPNPANLNNQKPGIALKPVNSNTQKPGIVPKPANQNNKKPEIAPKPGIAPKPANQNNQKPGIAPKPLNQNTQKLGTVPIPIPQNNQTQQNIANNAPKTVNKTNQDSMEVKQESTDNVVNPQHSTENTQGPKINLLNRSSSASEAGTSKSVNENINTVNVNPLALVAQVSVENKMEISSQNTTDQTKQNAPNKSDINNTKDDNANKTSTLVINPASLLTQKELVKSGKHLKDIMKNFELKDLMVIEFRYAGFTWRPMFKKLPDGAFKCLLCGTYILKNLDDLRQHNESVRHATSINAVEKLFHPNLAPTKDKNEREKKKLEEPEFRIHLPDLSLEEIKKVEYYVGGKWTPLINEAANVISCNLCNATSILTYTALIDHLMSKAHLGNLSHVDKLFHPTLTHDKASLESKIKNINPSQPMNNLAGTPRVICIEDSPEKEIMNTAPPDRDEDLTQIKESVIAVDTPNDEPKKVVNPVAILAQTNTRNKKISVIQNNDRVIPRSQYRPPPPVQTFNTMHTTPFASMPVQSSIMPPMQAPMQSSNFGLNQGEEMPVPSAVAAPQPRPKFSSKNITGTKMEEIEGFIGIEYVVKVVRNANDNMPKYECCLCEIESDGLGMQLHLKGPLHRRKFLERHFPTAMRQFTKYRDNVKYAPAMTQICEKFAIAIEKYHGRDLPYECLDDEFRANRDRVMSKVFSFRHASEHSGPSFTNIIDKKMLDEFISKSNHKMPEPDTNRTITFDPRHVSSFKRQREQSPPPLDVEQHKRLVEKFLENTTLPHSKRRSSYGRSPTRSSHHHRRSSPRKTSSKKTSFGSTDEWDNYMRMFDHAVKDLDTDYDEYKKDPEKHPMYDDEWKKYWIRKSKSLRNVGIDPSTYNFQPGWVRFFSRRVHQMYDNAVEDIRRSLRERLGLPHHNDNLSDIKYHIGAHCVDPINDEDDLLEKEDLELAREQNELGDFSMELPSELLDENKSEDNTKMDNPEDEADQSEDEMESETYNVVAVLRLLTALEDQLGSLGPKVNDLLSKALTLEKVKPNSSDENLITSENCVFFETVSEKLKGQVIAGMIVGNKLKAVKQAIRDLGNLLEMANKILSNRPKAPEPVKEVKIPTVQKRPARPTGSSEQSSKKLCLDKEEIATKLAAALAAQGKTDFSSEQLEQLVAVYTLIEKKRREATTSKKSEFLSEQQEKSLSETLLDFLKPNAEEPAKQENTSHQSQSFYPNKQIRQSTITSSFNKSATNTNRMVNMPSSSFSSNIQNRLQRPSNVLSDNFSQLRQFDTSLNISSLNRNSSVGQSWGSNMNSMQQLSNMNTTQGSFRQSSSFMNPNQNQSRLDPSMTGNTQINPFNFYQNQTNRGVFNTTEMSASRNQGQNQSHMREFSQRQLSSNIPVMTSNSMMRGGGNKNDNNPPMVSYPQANVRPNQRTGNFPPNMMQKDQVQPPMGWQRNNAGRR